MESITKILPSYDAANIKPGGDQTGTREQLRELIPAEAAHREVRTEVGPWQLIYPIPCRNAAVPEQFVEFPASVRPNQLLTNLVRCLILAFFLIVGVREIVALFPAAFVPRGRTSAEGRWPRKTRARNHIRFAIGKVFSENVSVSPALTVDA